MKGFGIYVKNDLLEPKHFLKMKSSIWLYLWLLDKMTSISEEGIGKVLGGKPVKFDELTVDLPMSDRTYTRYIEMLVEAEYITALRTPYGYVFTITKAKKIFQKKENRKVGGTEKKRTVLLAGENRTFGGNKEDSTVDNTNLLGETSSPPLPTKEEDMWNNKSDDFEEGVVDLDGDGSLKPEKKPQTRKYPNAPAIRKVFQEVLGKNPADWNKNTTVLQACENLYTERGVEKVRNALEFYKENKEREYCPIISTPVDLDRKYEKLGLFKKSS